MSKPNGKQRQVFCSNCDRTLTIEQHDTWGQHGKEGGNLQTMLGRIKFLRKKI